MTTDIERLSAEWWQQRWETADTGWDLGGEHPSMRWLLEHTPWGPAGHLLVPGCGGGWDAVALAGRYAVTGVDFAPSALEATRARAQAAGRVVHTVEADVLDWAVLQPAGSFDGVYEYTCLCAIDPSLRQRWAEAMTHLVRPGGILVWLAFPLQKDSPGGPPYVVSIPETSGMLEQWRCLHDDAAPVSPGPRAGRENLVIYERLG
jgi:SAM-dependent methyltransferase